MGDERPDLVVVFASPDHVGAFETSPRRYDGLCDRRWLIGLHAVAGIVGGAHEIEDGPAIATLAGCLP